MSAVPSTLPSFTTITSWFGVSFRAVRSAVMTRLAIVPLSLYAGKKILRPVAGPVVVIDFGTAVTYDAINAEGDYLGGAIAPGVEISLDALVSQTAMLRRVEPVAPDSVIGRNTVTSIQSGLVWGFVAQVEGMVARMVKELGGSAHVVATGGQAALVAGLTHVIEKTDPLLTVEGLRLIYLQNADGR